MRVLHGLESATSRSVRMYEPRLDRTRANERDLHDDVVQSIWFGMQHRSDLCPALDLKRSDRLTVRDEIVGRFAVGGQLVHLGASPSAHLDHVEGASHERQRAKPKKIEFRNADGIEIVLVE